MLNRTFTVDAPLPSHQEVSGVSELFPGSLLRENVDHLLQRALGDASTSDKARLAILDEDLELPAMEQDKTPFIAISRKDRRAGFENSLHRGYASPERKRTIPEPDRLQLPADGAVRNFKRQRIQTEGDFDGFSYEPSIFHFQGPADAPVFCEPPEVILIFVWKCLMLTFNLAHLVRLPTLVVC